MKVSLQWGGRFEGSPDAALLRFGSCMDEDMLLAPFDVRCSQAHVSALESGGVIASQDARALRTALNRIAGEIATGEFEAYARSCGAEDVHGAIDARVRALAPEEGELLHAGRSRNDQVATSLLLYVADRGAQGESLVRTIAKHFNERAKTELEAGTLLAGMTHWQPAQPVLLAFWLCAAAEPFARDMRAFTAIKVQALDSCPLGSAALAGSSLRLDRQAAAAALGFAAPSRNAMDAIGNRDAAIDVAYLCVRALVHASRLCEELVMWCTPSFGYASLADAASTGSSLMPQKRNPDPFELVRGTSAELAGRLAGALATTSGLALSYHRDLQITKRAVIEIVERSLDALRAFAGALVHVRFLRERMTAQAGEHYTAATDAADALIGGGQSARAAHAQVGASIRAHERDGTPLDWPDAQACVNAKASPGSTGPQAVRNAIASLEKELAG